MWRFDWHDTSYLLPCSESRRLQKFAREAIVPKLTDATPEQFEAAMASLERMKDTLVQGKKTFHFPASNGRHYCVQECFQDLAESLRAQWVLRPQPMPEPPPRQPLRTLEDVVRDLGDPFQPQPDETSLGIDEPLDSEESP
jgi:hypothetical protein